ncbi:MAG: SusC/RagA family TonB-linked outer membrane protein [Cyclobacteriaceae bacterium]|nr:SusC/RagA family TonB-linked outer membrane protein [Cyclobacteriaceae bacterium SS2]
MDWALATSNPPDSKNSTEEPVQQTVKGKVTGEDGEGIPGVNVVVKGTTTGVITDFNGDYTLNVPDGNGTLVFSSVGYQTVEQNIGNRSTIDVGLAQDVTALEEVVVIGYGTQQKKDLTGAIVNVQAEKVEKYKPTSVSEILRTTVPGLSVGYSTNARNVPDFNVRGDASIKADLDDDGDTEEERASNRPLVVLDGVIFRGDLAEINPNTISSIDVLKDASSAAIYGSQATNGVVIITTKKGSYGKPQITFSTRVGLVTGAKRMETYKGGEEVLDWLTDMNETITSTSTDPWSRFDDYYKIDPQYQDDWLAANGIPGETDPTAIGLARVANFGFWDIELENFANGTIYDWQDFLFHTGVRQDYDVSVSGRNERVSYYYSVGYSNRESVQLWETFETITSRLNLDVNLAEFLNIGANIGVTYQDEGQEPIGNGGYTTKSPYDQPWCNGCARTPENLNAQSAGSNQGNPYQTPSWNHRLYTRFMVNPTMFAKFTLPFGFSIRADYTPRFDTRKRFDFDMAGNPERAVDQAERRHNDAFLWQTNTIVSWDKGFGDHRFNVTGGYNAERNSYWETLARANNFSPTAALGFNAMNLGLNQFTQSSDEVNSRTGLFGRVNYAYGNRYNFSASIRRDGYSRFGEDNLYGNFPSLSAAWTVTNESFMPSSNLLSYLKLRLSWGVNGNSSGLEAYNAYARLSSGTYLNYDGGYFAAPYTELSRFALPGLSWERTSAVNLGIDYGLFNDRITGSLDLYKSQTTDLILDQSLPTNTGFSSSKTNVGTLENMGFDLGVNSINMTSQSFVWTSTLNVTYKVNKIVTFGNDPIEQPDGSFAEPDDLQNGWFIGKNKDIIWDFETDGVYKIGEEAEAAVYGLSPGDFRHVDQNNDGLINVEDKVFLGLDQNPWYVTLRNDVEWNGFDLGLVFLGKLGWLGQTIQPFNWEQGYIKNHNWRKVPYWTPNNQIDDAARINSIRLGGIQAALSKNYVRLQNVSLGYSLPSALLENINFTRVRLALNIENAAVWTPWIYGDPESEREMPRTYSFSLDFTF